MEAPPGRSDIPWLIGVTLFGGLLAPVTLVYSLPGTPAATAALLLNFEAVATTVIAAAGDNTLGQRRAATDPRRGSSKPGSGAGTVTLLAARAAGEGLPGPATAAAAMVVGFLCYGGLTSILFLLALRGIGAARAGSLLAISPFFGVLFSLLLFAELPAGAFYVALPVMALGAWLMVSEEHSHPHRHPATIHEHRHRHDDQHHDHDHEAGDPPLSAAGEHSHVHAHAELAHEHPHQPDIHHRHLHRR
jgi:drug/metabolite transporter (DMT)-like permease